jgi:hypothetical protein
MLLRLQVCAEPHFLRATCYVYLPEAQPDGYVTTAAGPC